MDSFMHNHQASLDSQREDNAIQDLEDAGVYPDDIYDQLYKKVMEENPNIQHHEATLLVYSRWYELDNELDDKDFPYEEENYD